MNIRFCLTLVIVPVKLKNIKSCSCLENKNDYLSGNGLYLYHDHKNCISSEHMKDFNTSGFFKVEGKPSWKFDCQFSFTPEEVEIIEEYYRRMGVGVCKCDKYYLCELCSHLTHRSFKNPKKYIISFLMFIHNLVHSLYVTFFIVIVSQFKNWKLVTMGEKMFTHGGTRTHNPRLRRPMPYPLGHVGLLYNIFKIHLLIFLL